MHLALVFIVLIFGAAFLYARHVNNTRANSQNFIGPTKFTTYVYGVNLEYPADWQPTPGYNYDRYNGESGFFGLSATGDDKSTIETLTRNEVEHKLRPYGLSPKTEALTIAGEPAMLILPSIDQDPAMKHQAELIVKYPKPVTVGSQVYYYFVLWADTDHIRDMAKSLSFL